LRGVGESEGAQALEQERARPVQIGLDRTFRYAQHLRHLADGPLFIIIERERAAVAFGQLIDAQAAGDFAAIESHDLPIVRIHLGADPAAGLAALETALAAALDQTPEG
jgi:hypothetical protein